MWNDKPFRIIVHITRGTPAGRALSLMANGLQVSGRTIEEASGYFDYYLDCAQPLLTSANKGTCFGLTAIINTETNELVRHEVLSGKGELVREEVGKPGRICMG